MNCGDCEQLFDAFLDGELGGSLRLEFEAHRVRCPRCRQALALLESIGPAIAVDASPSLSDDFTDRVMSQIAIQAPIRQRRTIRLLSAAAAFSGIAACVMWLSFTTPSKAVQTAAETKRNPEVVAKTLVSKDEARERVVQRFYSRLMDLHAAGREVSSQFLQLADYADVPLPPDIAKLTAGIADASPLMQIFESLLPGENEEVDTSELGPDEHAL